MGTTRTSMRTLIRAALAPLATSALLALLPAGPAASHTESDVVAVPAGGEATVTLAPTHGCDTAPTVEVSVRAPVAGAAATPVEGWTESAAPDGDGTVLRWTGGLLAADATGAFPVTFTAPDEPGRLLTFPAIQICEGGEELAWISGDPEADYPAPRLLVLPAGSAPAATIDDVPPDAPGREQLVEIVDVDNPGAEPEPEPAPSSSSTTAPAETTAPTTAGDDAAAPADPAPVADDEDGGSSLVIPLVVVAVLAAAGTAYMVLRKKPA